MKNSTSWHSMKLVVLGNGRIGKTTLLHTMLQLLKPTELQLVKPCKIKSTIGIDCSQISLAGGEVSIWDFGGQMEYTATHQFFLLRHVSSLYLFILLTSTPPADGCLHCLF
jgi:GTPase SAR1 family protein